MGEALGLSPLKTQNTSPLKRETRRDGERDRQREKKKERRETEKEREREKESVSEKDIKEMQCVREKYKRRNLKGLFLCAVDKLTELLLGSNMEVSFSYSTNGHHSLTGALVISEYFSVMHCVCVCVCVCVCDALCGVCLHM